MSTIRPVIGKHDRVAENAVDRHGRATQWTETDGRGADSE